MFLFGYCKFKLVSEQNNCFLLMWNSQTSKNTNICLFLLLATFKNYEHQKYIKNWNRLSLINLRNLKIIVQNLNADKCIIILNKSMESKIYIDFQKYIVYKFEIILYKTITITLHISMWYLFSKCINWKLINVDNYQLQIN